MTKTKKWLLGSVPGVVVMGVLTNALWEAAKPLSGSFIVFLLKIGTLGVQSLRDGIYKEIARGFHEYTSLETYASILTFAIAAGVATAFVTFRHRNKLLGVETETAKGGLVRNPTSKKVLLFVSTAYMLFCVTFFTFDIVRSVFINRSISYYNQVLTIVAPYINEQQYKLFESQFSQIETGKDYENIVTELETIATKNRLSLPQKPSPLFL